MNSDDKCFPRGRMAYSYDKGFISILYCALPCRCFAPKVPRPEGRGASCIHSVALASGETVWRGVVVNNGPSPPACMPPFRVRNNVIRVLCLSPLVYVGAHAMP